MGHTTDNDLTAAGGLDDVAGLICLQCFDGSIRQLIGWLNCRTEPRKGADLLPERPRLSLGGLSRVRELMCLRDRC